MAPIPYMTLGSDSSILNANKAAARMLEAEHKVLFQKRLGVFVADESKPVFNTFINKAFASQKQEMCEVSLIINSHYSWYILLAIADKSLNSILVAAQDITKQKIAEEIILREANYDLVTGLPNRRLFQDRLKQELFKAQRNKRKFALMFLDLDRFKDINDSMGHEMGDLVLKETALRLTASTRDTDTVARSGGDEFIIILVDLDDLAPLERIAESILNSIRAPFQLGENRSFITTSIGISIFPDDAHEIEELMKKADQAMYTAKNEGRNCHRYFTHEMQQYIQKRLTIVNDLHSVLDEHQLKIEYQPIVELATGQTLIAEALIRWQHPQNGTINPSNFISIAEETGKIISIDNWVLHQVTQQLEKWRSLFDRNLKISLNISSTHFKKIASNMASWLYHLDGLHGDVQNIIVEINEDLLIEGQNNVYNQLMKFREKKMGIALNNFGTGYSSLLALNKFKIDYLKIDRNFVANLLTHSNNLALCEAIIGLAHKFGIKVIAVGVETKKQLELLRAAGCDYGQGYVFRKPLTYDAFEQFMKNQN